MSVADTKIANFEKSILLPSLTEISQSPALLRDYTAEVVTKRPHPDANVEELLAGLGGALRRREGLSLVLSNRERPPGISVIGGHYVVTAFHDVQGDEVFVSPGVMFWMRFNNKLHAFNHRYDNNVARHRIEDVTRPHVLNHVLGSFDFYKINAFSEKAFPGYR
jgi:hypothetical protein